jgi:amino acid efflux transporter
MLAGCRILHGRSRLMAATGLGLCVLLMVIIGWKSLYALAMLVLIWLVLPRKTPAVVSKQ